MSISICSAQERALIRAMDVQPAASHKPVKTESPALQLQAPIVVKPEPAKPTVVTKAIWLERAAQGDRSFSDLEFLQLPREWQQEIYRVANERNRAELVEKLNRLSLGNKDPIVIQSPSILAPNMDCLAVRKAILDFFVDLRQKKLLLTTKEAGLSLKQTPFTECQSATDRTVYIYKGTDMDRLLGSLHLQRAADIAKRPDVRAPRKILVVDEREEIVTLSVTKILSLRSKHFHLFAAKVDGKKADHEDLQKVKDFALNQACYTDFHQGNILVTKDGTKHFIDTPFENFSTGTDYHPNRAGAVTEADLAMLRSLGLGGGPSESAAPSEPVDESDALRVEQYKRFGFDANRTFTFTLKELFE